MATIVRPHPYPDGATARPDHANKNETTLYNLVNGNLDFENLKATLQNAANGLVKLDADAKVPIAQLPTTIPSGVIVMWSGSLATIPAGWSLCDGAGGTPDLREKFVRGAPAATEPGGAGGADSITLAIANLPSHTHGVGTLVAGSGGAVHTHGAGTLAVASGGAHTHSVSGTAASTGAHTHSWGYKNEGSGAGTTAWGIGRYHNQENNKSTTSAGNHGHSVSGTAASGGSHGHAISGSTASGGGAHTHTISGITASVGSGTAFDNRPAYYEIAYIMKT